MVPLLTWHAFAYSNECCRLLGQSAQQCVFLSPTSMFGAKNMWISITLELAHVVFEAYTATFVKDG